MSSCRPVISRVLPIALLSLGLAFASPVGAITSEERCVRKVDKLEARYTKCLAAAQMSTGNMSAGSTLEDDLLCESRFTRRMDFFERWATRKDLGAECTDRMPEAARNGAQAAILVGAGRDLSDYPHLSLADLAGSEIDGILDQTFDEGYDEGYDDGLASAPDVTSNDETVCTAAGGAWNMGTCTPASSYDCWVGGFCSEVAHVFPYLNNYPSWSNVYEGHTQSTEPALGAGCNVPFGDHGSTYWAQATHFAQALGYTGGVARGHLVRCKY